MNLFALNSFIYGLQLLALDPAKSLKLSEDYSAFWDRAREYTVGGNSFSSDLITKTIEQPVNILIVIGVGSLCASVLYQSSFKKSDGLSVFLHNLPQFLWAAFIMFLLANGYSNAFKVADSSWAFRGLMRERTASISIINTQISNAMANQLFHTQYGQAVTDQFAECEALPIPTVRLPKAATTTGAEGLTVEQRHTAEFISCMETLQETVERNYEDLQEQCGETLDKCEVIKERTQTLAKQVDAGVRKIKKQFELSDIGLPNIPLPDLSNPLDPNSFRSPGLGIFVTADDIAFLGNSVSSAIAGVGEYAHMQLVSLGNQLYTGFINISFMFAGLFFPIAVAWALIPGKKVGLVAWFITMLALIIAEQTYLITLGIVSVISFLPEFSEIGPTLFLATLGILAPIMAGFSGFGSGWMMAQRYQVWCYGCGWCCAGGSFGGHFYSNLPDAFSKTTKEVNRYGILSRISNRNHCDWFIPYSPRLSRKLSL